MPFNRRGVLGGMLAGGVFGKTAIKAAAEEIHRITPNGPAPLPGGWWKEDLNEASDCATVQAGPPPKMPFDAAMKIAMQDARLWRAIIFSKRGQKFKTFTRPIFSFPNPLHLW